MGKRPVAPKSRRSGPWRITYLLAAIALTLLALGITGWGVWVVASDTSETSRPLDYEASLKHSFFMGTDHPQELTKVRFFAGSPKLRFLVGDSKVLIGAVDMEIQHFRTEGVTPAIIVRLPKEARITDFRPSDAREFGNGQFFSSWGVSDTVRAGARYVTITLPDEVKQKDTAHAADNAQATLKFEVPTFGGLRRIDRSSWLFRMLYVRVPEDHFSPLPRNGALIQVAPSKDHASLEDFSPDIAPVARQDPFEGWLVTRSPSATEYRVTAVDDRERVLTDISKQALWVVLGFALGVLLPFAWKRGWPSSADQTPGAVA